MYSVLNGDGWSEPRCSTTAPTVPSRVSRRHDGRQQCHRGVHPGPHRSGRRLRPGDRLHHRGQTWQSRHIHAGHQRRKSGRESSGDRGLPAHNLRRYYGCRSVYPGLAQPENGSSDIRLLSVDSSGAMSNTFPASLSALTSSGQANVSGDFRFAHVWDSTTTVRALSRT